MKITVRGNSVKMDDEARALIVQALHSAATTWLNEGADEDDPSERISYLSMAGDGKALAMLLEPKAEEVDAAS